MAHTNVRIHALYRSRGLTGLSSAIYDPERRSTWLQHLPPAQRQYAQLLSTQLDGLVSSHELAHGWLLDERKKVPIIRLLESAPGIAEWTKDRQGRWVRDVAQTRGLNCNRNTVLKSVFKGAAETVIRQVPQHPLVQAYEATIAAGTKPNLAKLTLARRLAAVVLAMWKRKEKYDLSKHQR